MVEVLTLKRAASFLREPSLLSTASRIRLRRSFERGCMGHLLKNGPSNRAPSGCAPLYPVSLPCGRATTEAGDVGLTQLPIEKNADGVVGTNAPVGLIG